MRALACWAAAATFACVLVPLALSGEPPAAADKPVSFRNDIQPIFDHHCTVCHRLEDPVAGLILEPTVSYVSLVGVPSMENAMARVSPKDPQGSYLLHKIEWTHLAVNGKGYGMPPVYFAFLSVEERALVRTWIEQGAPNN